MNFHLLKQDVLTLKYTNVLKIQGAEQIIAGATGIGGRSFTLIDHTICKRNMFLSSRVFPITITNHHATSVTTPYEVTNNRRSLLRQRIRFLCNEGDHSRMLLDLE